MMLAKKIGAILMAAVLLAGCLAGCGKTGQCDSCGQTESLKKFVDRYGNENWYCEDCYRMAKFVDS